MLKQQQKHSCSWSFKEDFAKEHKSKLFCPSLKSCNANCHPSSQSPLLTQGFSGNFHSIHVCLQSLAIIMRDNCSQHTYNRPKVKEICNTVHSNWTFQNLLIKLVIISLFSWFSQLFNPLGHCEALRQSRKNRNCFCRPHNLTSIMCGHAPIHGHVYLINNKISFSSSFLRLIQRNLVP